MSTAQSDIRSAIIQRYKNAALSVPTAYPNAQFTEPDSSSPFIRLFVMVSDSVPATLGTSGQDRHDGLLQLHLMYPANEGEGDAVSMADTLLSWFRAGMVETYNGQDVYFLGGSRSPGQIEEGRWRITLNIRWYAFSLRS